MGEFNLKNDPNLKNPHSFISILHQEALKISRELKKQEFLLIEVLQKIESTKTYGYLGFKSLYQYATCGLGLSEGQAYNFITVSRKASQIEKLQEALASGSVTISKAKRISSVITNENADKWIGIAQKMSQRWVEREVSRVNPKSCVQEGSRFISENTLEFRAAISEKTDRLLRRVEDLLCQSKGRAVSKDELLREMARLFIERKDPVEKAKRVLVRKIRRENKNHKKDCSQRPIDEQDNSSHRPVNISSAQRRPLKANPKHKVFLRDEGKCQVLNPDGSKCDESRWIDVHHVIPVSHGGTDTIENLTTLCRRHHQMLHLRDLRVPSV